MRGYSLIELVIVLALLGILSGIGWASYQEHRSRYRLVQVAKHLQSNLIRLKAKAVATNREARLHLISPGACSDPTNWGGRWSLSLGDRNRGSTNWDLLPEDTFDDGVDDDASEGYVDLGQGGNLDSKDICLEHWGSIIGPGNGVASDSIVFDTRGWLRNPASDFSANGAIEIRFINQESVRNGFLEEIIIQVSRAGMIRLLRSEDQGLSGGATMGVAEGTTIQ